MTNKSDGHNLKLGDHLTPEHELTEEQSCHIDAEIAAERRDRGLDVSPVGEFQLFGERYISVADQWDIRVHPPGTRRNARAPYHLIEDVLPEVGLKDIDLALRCEITPDSLRERLEYRMQVPWVVAEDSEVTEVWG